ncbi:TPA_asm: hypothetical protein G0G78_26060 [Salmonella enterica]|nr:hypothetical protein [Salmonella enterica]ECO1900076.1 hypothetical protein [Salmonella enterica subsp. diarizonae]EAO7618749.1 hypothetical protein [Salmonella enterica]EAQ6819412.1 hypothetical protein [Salmonella enterica]EAU3477183.1 hypothetical protein [Salmonella enterica]
MFQSFYAEEHNVFLLTTTTCKHEKDTQYLIYQLKSTIRCRFLSMLQTGLRKRPSFLPHELLMKAVISTLALIPAVIAFTFQRADVANRIDYVEEDSVF